MAGYIANRRVVIDGTVYNQGDEIPSSELMPFYFKNLVRRGHVLRTEQDVDTEDVQSLIDASINSLIDTAPEALNTLNELAAALGEDADFAGTVTTSLAGKIDKITGTDNAIVRSDGTSGAVQDSGVLIDDSDNVTGVTSLNAATIAGTAGTGNIGVNLQYQPFPSRTTGIGLTAVGDTALTNLTTGSYTTAFGFGAGRYASGTDQTFVGAQAGWPDQVLGNATTSAAGVTLVGSDTWGRSGQYATAVGYHAKADADYSLALGKAATATGAGSVAIGTDSGGVGASTATADNQIALGTANHTVYVAGGFDGATFKTTGTNVAAAAYAVASGGYSVAVGHHADATANHAVAIGRGAQATHVGSVAIGNDSASTAAATTAADQIVLGTALHTVTVPGTLTVGGIISVDGTTDSTSTVTGSIHTDGGLGVAKSVYVGGDTHTTGLVRDVSTASSGPVTLTAADHIFIATSGTFTVNLPAIGTTGREFIIQNSGAGVITVDGNSTETINGSTTQTLNQYESLTVIDNGTEWSIL